MGLRAFVVRDGNEISRAASEAGLKVFFCTNSAALAVCRERGLDSLLLDESAVREEYRGINTFGMRQTFAFVEKFRADWKSFVFVQTAFMKLEGYFTQILKDVLVLQKAITLKKPESLAIFEQKGSILAAMGDRLGDHLGIGVQILPPADQNTPTSRLALKNILYTLAGKVVSIFSYAFLFFAAKSGKKRVSASGALNHLGEVAGRIQASGRTVIFCENEFNLEKFRFCLRRGILFLILPRSVEAMDPLKPGMRYFPEGSAVYRGISYSPLLESTITNLLRDGVAHFPFDFSTLEKFFKKIRFESVVLDEEWAMRRMVSVFCRRLGIPCFIVSHGLPGMNLDDTAADILGRYECSATVAGSEFEKIEFETICYPLFQVHVLGIPRYDRIFESKKQAQKDPKKPKTVLYCGASMKSFDFEDPLPYLALGNFLRDSTEKYTADILEVCSEGKDLFLQIKPHYSQTGLWRSCVTKAAKEGQRYELLPHNDDTFRLLRDADVIITVESTVIVEAILFDKPVILLNYPKDELIVPYDKHGLVRQVHSKEELKEAIQTCLHDERYLEEIAVRRREVFSHYSGPFDGRNAERTAEFILGAAA